MRLETAGRERGAVPLPRRATRGPLSRLARPPWSGGTGARLYPYVLMAPAVLLVGIGILYPVAYLAYLSLYEYSPFFTAGAIRFVGLANYSRLLDDPEFWHALRVSGIWVVGSVVPQFLLGLGMALLLNERFAGRGTVRTLILAPWAVSGVIAAIIWGWIFDGTVGVLNDLLLKASIVDTPVAWSLQPVTTWFMVFVANAWRGAPFFAIMLLAALQGISPDLYESAKVDGASRWQRFRSITLPLIMNTVILATLLRSIWTFNYIDLLWTMTGGGPIDATRTLPIMVFDTTYLSGDFGYAAALAMALCLILLLFGAVYWRLNRFAHDA